MKIILVGHLRKLFDSGEIALDGGVRDVSDLLIRINQMKKNGTASLNRENMLLFVNDVEISALNDLMTELGENDIITLVPITHGG